MKQTPASSGEIHLGNLIPQQGYLWESWAYRFPPRSVWRDSEFQSLWRGVGRTLFQNTLQMIKGTALHRSQGLKSSNRFIQQAFPPVTTDSRSQSHFLCELHLSQNNSFIRKIWFGRAEPRVLSLLCHSYKF